MIKQHSKTSLRELLADDSRRPVVTVGVGDAMSARLACNVQGIDVVFTSGFAISAQQLGLPDVEMYTRTENVQAIERICYVSSKPVLADMDTGYGNAVNVIKSLHDFERAGVQGVVIEDQISPKKCPVCVDTTNTILPLNEAVGKIRAAVENRLNPETLIIARTDAVDFDEAVARAKAYYAAGADLVQPISRVFSDKHDIKRFVDAVEAPVSLVVLGWMEALSREELEALGVKIVHFALVPVTTIHHAVKEVMAQLGAARAANEIFITRSPHPDIVRDMGMAVISELEDKYLPKESEL